MENQNTNDDLVTLCMEFLRKKMYDSPNPLETATEWIDILLKEDEPEKTNSMYMEEL